MIEIQALTKYYGDRKAVGPLSFSIAKGEIIGLLGLNGAGKTTTLRILACDLLPSSGSVRIEGLDVVDHPDEVRALAAHPAPVYEISTLGGCPSMNVIININILRVMFFYKFHVSGQDLKCLYATRNI